MQHPLSYGVPQDVYTLIQLLLPSRSTLLFLGVWFGYYMEQNKPKVHHLQIHETEVFV
jgi:hypothetical protein